MMIGYVLLALGITIFVLSFVIPVKTEEEKEIEFSEDLIRQMVGKEVESAKNQITDVVDETVSYAMEKTERSMDRLTNEKIMAVNEYSDTVLAQINKNQQEVVFLYDMLNDKHDTLMDAVSEVDKKATEVQRTVQDAQIAAMETQSRVEEASKRAQVTSKQIEEASKQAQVTSKQVEEASKQVQVTSKQMERTSDNEKTTPAEGTAADFEPFNAGKLEKINFAVEENADTKITADINDYTNSDISEDKGINAERMSALERLKVASNANEVGNLNDSIDLAGVLTDTAETVKTSRKKKTTRTKPHQNSEETTNIKKDAPSLNLGTDSVGKPVGGRNNNEIILELHNKGKSNMAIAKELGLGIGEVKLVIDLFEGM